MNESDEESFTAIPQPVREQISPGIHTVEITRAENGFANGKRLVEITLELSPDFWPVQTRVWKTQNSVGVMQNVLRSAGYDIQPGQRFTFGPEQLVSRMCRVRIGKNERGYLDVLRWLPPRHSESAQPEPNDSEWDAPEHGESRGSSPAGAPLKPTGSPISKNDLDGDDLPF
jgi:hypothetical protein